MTADLAADDGMRGAVKIALAEAIPGASAADITITCFDTRAVCGAARRRRLGEDYVVVFEAKMPLDAVAADTGAAAGELDGAAAAERIASNVESAMIEGNVLATIKHHAPADVGAAVMAGMAVKAVQLPAPEEFAVVTPEPTTTPPTTQPPTTMPPTPAQSSDVGTLRTDAEPPTADEDEDEDEDETPRGNATLAIVGGIGGLAVLGAVAVALHRHKASAARGGEAAGASSGEVVEMENPMRRGDDARAMGDARRSLNVSEWAHAHLPAGSRGGGSGMKTRDSRIMLRQPSTDAKPVPKHLDHKHVPTHRKNYRRNHAGSVIMVKAEDTGHEWHMAKDPKSGESYYFNENSGEVSWENPNEAAERAAALEREHHMLADHTAQNQPERASGTRDDGWEQVRDDRTGGVYWWNRHTGETAWDEPAAADGKPGSSSGPEKQHGPAEAVEGLPNGWTAYTDPETGREFFVNESTGATSWVKPSSRI